VPCPCSCSVRRTKVRRTLARFHFQNRIQLDESDTTNRTRAALMDSRKPTYTLRRLTYAKFLRSELLARISSSNIRTLISSGRFTVAERCVAIYHHPIKDVCYDSLAAHPRMPEHPRPKNSAISSGANQERRRRGTSYLTCAESSTADEARYFIATRNGEFARETASRESLALAGDRRVSRLLFLTLALFSQPRHAAVSGASSQLKVTDPRLPLS